MSLSRRTLLRALAVGFAAPLVPGACTRDCAAGLTAAHRQRIATYAQFVGFARALVESSLQRDYPATLAALANALGNDTLRRLATDLQSVLADDALARIKDGLPVLTRTAVDVALKVVGDPQSWLRGKIVGMIADSAFYKQLVGNADGLQRLPKELDAALASRDTAALARAAQHGAADLEYFHAALDGLRDVAAAELPYVGVSLFRAVEFCAGRPSGAVAGTVDTALREVREVIDALAATARACAS